SSARPARLPESKTRTASGRHVAARPTPGRGIGFPQRLSPRRNAVAGSMDFPGSLAKILLFGLPIRNLTLARSLPENPATLNLRHTDYANNRACSETSRAKAF